MSNIENKCPNCGSTDISPVGEVLHCNYCNYEFEIKKFNKKENNEEKIIISDGSKDINKEIDKLITLKCSGCGADVTVNLEDTVTAKCHWCRTFLSIDDKVPTGLIPDMLLPFKLRKEEAKSLMENFAGKRQFFATKEFKEEFSTENILGVYMPYFVVDSTDNAYMAGKGEETISQRTYTDKNKRVHTVYTVRKYEVETKFNLETRNLTIESQKSARNFAGDKNSQNIINAIMPFDVENSLEFNSNYTKGYNIENRDLNVVDMKDEIEDSIEDISKYLVNQESEISDLDRGIRWTDIKIKNIKRNINSAYFPIWLYSYMDTNNIIHYIATNARTGETLGAIPTNFAKLGFFSFLLGVITFTLMALYSLIKNDNELILDKKIIIVPLIVALGFYYMKKIKYRNRNKRHDYECSEDNSLIDFSANIKPIGIPYKTENPFMAGANNKSYKGDSRIDSNIIERELGKITEVFDQ